MDEQKTHFHAGWNMVGYLPEMDVATFSDWADAKQYMIDELERWADLADMDDEEEHDQAEELSSTAADLNYTSGPEWGTIVGNESFWITPCTEDCPEDDES